MSTHRRKRTTPSHRPSSRALPHAPNLPPEVLDSFHALGPVMLVNPDGTVGAVNRAALDLLGYAADEVLGQPVGRFFAERKRWREWRTKRQLMGPRPPLLPTPANATLWPSLVRWCLDALARSFAVVHVARSGHTSPTPPLSSEARARLKQLLDITPDAIIELDEDQRILTFNRVAEEIFGYRAEEVLGGRIWAENRPTGGVAICFSRPKSCEEGLND